MLYSAANSIVGVSCVCMKGTVLWLNSLHVAQFNQNSYAKHLSSKKKSTVQSFFFQGMLFDTNPIMRLN